MIELLDKIKNNSLGKVVKNISLKDLTSIGCGGNVEYVYLPKNLESLREVYKYLNYKGIRHYIIGNGTNVLAHDTDYKGLLILLKEMPYSYKINDSILEVSAFYPTMKLVYDLAKIEIGDLSFLGGIPGLIGGAIYNNCGAYNDEVKNHLEKVEYIDTAGNTRYFNTKDLLLNYRYSIFHQIPGIITKAYFNIEKNVKTLEKLEKRRLSRRESQPLNSKNMGCIFKNSSIIRAWEVVNALGLRGYRIGDAMVSMKHSNFIINVGSAKSKDIISLIRLIQERAENELGIILRCEISYFD